MKTLKIFLLVTLLMSLFLVSACTNSDDDGTEYVIKIDGRTVTLKDKGGYTRHIYTDTQYTLYDSLTLVPISREILVSELIRASAEVTRIINEIELNKAGE